MLFLSLLLVSCYEPPPENKARSRTVIYSSSEREGEGFGQSSYHAQAQMQTITDGRSQYIQASVDGNSYSGSMTDNDGVEIYFGDEYKY